MARAGEILGSYQLLEELGVGGGGAVFRAKHVLLGRIVAIKVMNEDLVGEQELISRFFHEARIVNEIHHPNIIDIVDFLDLYEPRRVAYVMELLRGKSLHEVARAKTITPVQAANACLQIVSVLRAVHGMRVVHRDLKPDNVFVLAGADADWSAVPSVKVLDFGIAKLDPTEVQHRTKTGVAFGTPLYMAPEQFLAAPVSPATDIYALGEILFEVLRGESLFDGTNREVLKQKISLKPTGTLSFPQLANPAPVIHLIQRCIAIAPEERPSLNEIEDVLHAMKPRDTLPPPPRALVDSSDLPTAIGQVTPAVAQAARPRLVTPPAPSPMITDLPSTLKDTPRPALPPRRDPWAFVTAAAMGIFVVAAALMLRTLIGPSHVVVDAPVASAQAPDAGR